jgi:tetratricopeptide (TPR) repeat protein
VAALAITLGATAVVLLGQGDDPEQPSPPEKDAPEAGGQGGGAPAQAGTDVDPAETSLEPLFATDGVGDPARGAALNAQGRALVDRGQPEAAVPILVEAVRSFPEGTDDIQYAYALYNLGEALLRSGRPEEAIPILERRLQIPDQPGVVRATLRDARAAAGG